MPKGKPSINPSHLEVEGVFHDLDDILNWCLKVPQLRMAEGVTIGWYGDRTIVRKKWSFLALYDWRRKHIRVNRILDQSWVPLYYMRSIVCHELLHHLIPWKGTEYHPKQFIEAEKLLPFYDRSEVWYDKNIDRLLGRTGLYRNR